MVTRGAVEEEFVDHVDDLGCKVGGSQSEINPAVSTKVGFERLVDGIPIFPDIDQTKEVTELL